MTETDHTAYPPKGTGKGVPFERIRRITGYISKLSQWNDAKSAEEAERVKHGVEES